MTEPGPISLAYLAARPVAAARVLAALPPAEVAAFLAGVPARLGAAALAAMSPWHAGACLAELEPRRAATLLEALPGEQRARCLRAADEAARVAILAELPQRRARSIRRQLRYPEALIGARMAGEVTALAPDRSVADAIGEIAARAEGATLQVYVVDSGGAPVGVVPLAALLQAAPAQPLERIMQRDFGVLAADAALSGLEGGAGWGELPERPVVDARGRLVGALALTQVVAGRGARAAGTAAETGAMAALVGGLGVAVGGLLRTLAGLLAPAWESSRDG